MTEYTLSEKELQIIDAAMAPSKRSYDSDEHFAADREKIKTEVLAEKKKNGGKTLIKVELDEIKGEGSIIIIIDRTVRCFFDDGETSIVIIIPRTTMATATSTTEYTLSEKELQVIDAGMIKDPRYSDFERIKTEVLAKKKENCGKTLIKVQFDYKDNMNPPINHYRYFFEGDEIPAATATAEYTLSEKELQVIDAAMAPSKRQYNNDEHFAADREKIKTEVLAEKKKNGGKTLIKVELDEIKGEDTIIIIIDRTVRCFFDDGETSLIIVIPRATMATATASSKYSLSEKELQVIDAGMAPVKADYMGNADHFAADRERIKAEVLAKKKENGGKKLIKVEFDYKDKSNPPIFHYRYTFE